MGTCMIYLVRTTVLAKENEESSFRIDIYLSDRSRLHAAMIGPAGFFLSFWELIDLAPGDLPRPLISRQCSRSSWSSG